jgi:hypothetical protein
LLILFSQGRPCPLRNSLTSSPRHTRHLAESLMDLFLFYYKPSIGVRAVFRSGQQGSSLSTRHYHFHSLARKDKRKVKATVNYIYFLLSGSKCLWFTSMENITLISL